MLTTIRRKLAVGGVVAMLAVLILTTGSLFAQSPTPAPGGTPTGDQMGMMDMASPAAGAAPMDQMMTQMMEQCLAMMKMMMGMMGGGDMSGLMATPGTGMEGMNDMENMTTPTITSDQ